LQPMQRSGLQVARISHDDSRRPLMVPLYVKVTAPGRMADGASAARETPRGIDPVRLLRYVSCSILSASRDTSLQETQASGRCNSIYWLRT
jgi:hypothetical protein